MNIFLLGNVLDVTEDQFYEYEKAAEKFRADGHTVSYPSSMGYNEFKAHDTYWLLASTPREKTIAELVCYCKYIASFDLVLMDVFIHEKSSVFLQWFLRAAGIRYEYFYFPSVL